MSVQELVASRRRDILRTAARHGGRDVRVFGSAARGEARPGSDIDILAPPASGRSLLDLVAIRQDLEDLLGRHVDVVTEVSVNPCMCASVLKDAVRP